MTSLAHRLQHAVETNDFDEYEKAIGDIAAELDRRTTRQATAWLHAWNKHDARIRSEELRRRRAHERLPDEERRHRDQRRAYLLELPQAPSTVPAGADLRCPLCNGIHGDLRVGRVEGCGCPDPVLMVHHVPGWERRYVCVHCHAVEVVEFREDYEFCPSIKAVWLAQRCLPCGYRWEYGDRVSPKTWARLEADAWEHGHFVHYEPLHPDIFTTAGAVPPPCYGALLAGDQVHRVVVTYAGPAVTSATPGARAAGIDTPRCWEVWCEPLEDKEGK